MAAYKRAWYRATCFSWVLSAVVITLDDFAVVIGDLLVERISHYGVLEQK